jgi:hypothetical protein
VRCVAGRPSSGSRWRKSFAAGASLHTASSSTPSSRTGAVRGTARSVGADAWAEAAATGAAGPGCAAADDAARTTKQATVPAARGLRERVGEAMGDRWERLSVGGWTPFGHPLRAEGLHPSRGRSGTAFGRT